MVKLRENLKNEIDKLSEEQLKLVAVFFKEQLGLASVLTGAKEAMDTTTPWARAKHFREWASQLPQDSPSLSAEDVGRDSIYEG